MSEEKISLLNCNFKQKKIRLTSPHSLLAIRLIGVTLDELRHLSFVKDHYHGKIVFLVNRIDQYRKGVDSIKETLDKIHEDLTKLGFTEPEVFPVSAYAGYLGKMALNNEILNEDELDELDLLKRKLKRDEFSYEKYYKVSVNEQSYKNEIEELLLHSGILSLEKMLYE